MNFPTNDREYWPTENWQKSEPDAGVINVDRLINLESTIKSQYRNMNGIVIVHRGNLVYEKYFNGYGPDDTHHLASVTKSVISGLVGIAIDQGLINSVDEKVITFFPEYSPAMQDFQKKAVSIRHLLTMTAPIASKSTSMCGNEALDRLRRQKNWVNYILNQLGRHGTLGEFQYSTAGSHLLSAILTKTTGMSARAFANQVLFNPIGMREIPDQPMQSFRLEDVFSNHLEGWIKDPQGHNTGGWGLALSPRDMARFGYLFLNQGYWDGKQIISQQWVKESVKSNENEYGYLWWLRKINDLETFSALGSGGNVISCIPEKDLVIAIASKIVMKPKDPWDLLSDLLFS